MPDTLFVSDMDGTLLGADSKISAASARMLNEAAAKGAMFTVATARTPATVDPLLTGVETRIPAVVMTGAGLWDHQHGRYISLQTLSHAQARIAAETCMQYGLIPVVYRRGAGEVLQVYHPENVTEPSAVKFLQERSHLQLKKLHPVADPLARLSGDDSVLLLALGPKSAVQSAVSDLQSVAGMSVSWYSDPGYPGVYFLEIFGPDVSKAHGLQRLRDFTGIQNVTVFGDNYNDLPLFDAANHAVAVENAVEDVRAAANEVIGPNTSDAVARYVLAHTLQSERKLT